MASASVIRCQNLLFLIKQLNLPVNIKVHKLFSPSGNCAADGTRDYVLVVHALHDRVFKKYLQNATQSDLMLYRGLFLKAQLSADLKDVHGLEVQQAFLPKFENEGQDADIARAIVDGADARYIVVTIKHSGSLLTLSADLLGAKNSLDNSFTRSGALVLHAHFRRAHGADGDAALSRLIAHMRERRLAVSFELVTRWLGHHGQLPEGDYLVATSAHATDDQGRVHFLPWLEFLRFCAAWRLPVNDTWLFPGRTAAQGVVDMLDSAAMSGRTTNSILADFATAVKSTEGAVHLPGTYPHGEWQGTRIEGFVVAQGDVVGDELRADLEALAGELRSAALSISAQPPELKQLGIPSANSPELLAAFDALPAEAGIPRQRLAVAPTSEAAAVLAAIEAASPLPEGALWVGDPEPSEAMSIDASGSIPMPTSMQISGDADRVHGAPPRAFSRAAIARTSSETLAQFVKSSAALEEAMPLVAALRRSAGETADAAEQQRVMAAVAGRLDVTMTLRFKKKMMMIGTEEVGYCLMTFILRNGIRVLKSGPQNFLMYVRKWTERWGLGPAAKEKYVEFATAWVAWVKAHGGAKALDPQTYLDVAEPFVSAFLAGTAPGVRRPEGAFQGVVVTLNLSEAVTTELAMALSVHHVPKLCRDLPFSRELVRGGSVISIDPWEGRPQVHPSFMAEAAPFMYVVACTADLEYCAQLKKMPKPPRTLTPNEEKALCGKYKGCWALVNQALSKQWGADGPKLAGRVLMLDAGRCLTASPPDVASDLVRRLGAGTRLPEQDPGFVATFLTMPGIGKSTWVTSSALRDDPELEVVVMASDELCARDGSDGGGGKRDKGNKKRKQGNDANQKVVKMQPREFWPAVARAAATERGDGRPTLLLADKNLLDSPPGNLDRVLGCLRSQLLSVIGVVPLPAEGPLPTPQGPRTPGGLPLLALCMRRVLCRGTDHAGGLHSGLQEAMRVCAQFAGFSRGVGREEILEAAAAHYDAVIPLEVAGPPAECGLPLDVLAHLAEAVANSGHGANKMSQEWEDTMREMLNRPQVVEALDGWQRPVAAINADLASALKAAVSGKGVVGTSEGSIRYIAVAGIDEAALKEAVAAVLPAELQPKMKVDLHITLWHRDDAPARRWGDPSAEGGGDDVFAKADDASPRQRGPSAGESREGLLAQLGERVAFEVTHVDTSPQVTAARVRLLDGPDQVVSCTKRYPHVTLVIGDAALAKDANELPRRLEAGEAGVQSLRIDPPLGLEGQLVAFT